MSGEIILQSECAVTERRISSMDESTIENVHKLQDYLLKYPQTKIPTSHLIHAGMYARTVMVPAGVMLVGSLMKVATILILSGSFVIYVDDEPIRLDGYNVFYGQANRKQAGVAISDTYVTMIFTTNAHSVFDAENEFTDEASLLASRHEDSINHICVTGV